METAKQRMKHRYDTLRATGRCVDCAVSRSMKGRARCYGCQQKQKRYDSLHRVQFVPPASALSNDELYRRAKTERELTSWAWRHPA